MIELTSVMDGVKSKFAPASRPRTKTLRLVAGGGEARDGKVAGGWGGAVEEGENVGCDCKENEEGKKGG